MAENDDDHFDLLKISHDALNLHSSNKTLINQLHTLIIQFEEHLDVIIKKYKVMSITLLVATGAAIGFSFSGELVNVHLNKLAVASVISVFGMIGLFAIWHLDVQVFHKLWGSFFIEEVRMEATHPFLLEIGDVAVSLESINVRLIGDTNWYIFLHIILGTTAATIFSFMWESMAIKCGIFAAAAVFVFAIASYMIHSANKLLSVVEHMIHRSRS